MNSNQIMWVNIEFSQQTFDEVNAPLNGISIEFLGSERMDIWSIIAAYNGIVALAQPTFCYARIELKLN